MPDRQRSGGDRGAGRDSGVRRLPRGSRSGASQHRPRRRRPDAFGAFPRAGMILGPGYAHVVTDPLVRPAKRSERFGQKLLLAVLFLITPAITHAQAPEKGSNEIQVWAGGGHSVPGGTKNTGAFNAGLRYGWVLTDPHLPGLLRGRFEYALDAGPILLIFQPANTAFGLGFDPLGLKWNFER